MGLGSEGMEVTVLWDLETVGSQQSESQARGLTAWLSGALTYSLTEAVALAYTHSCNCPSVRSSSAHFTIHLSPSAHLARPSTYPSIYLPIHGLHLPIHQKPNHSFIYPPTYPTIYSPFQTTHIPTHPPTTHPSRSISPCTRPPIHLSTIRLSTYLPWTLPNHPSTYLLTHPSLYAHTHISTYLPSSYQLPTHLTLLSTHPRASILLKISTSPPSCSLPLESHPPTYPCGNHQCD